MKKLLLTITAALVLATGNLALAQESPAVPVETPATSATSLETELIGDVAVPYSILLDLQMENQGFAVSEARETHRDGQQVFILRMDNTDSRSNGSFYLLYDSSWAFLRRESAPVETPPETESIKKSIVDKLREYWNNSNEDDDENDGSDRGDEDEEEVENAANPAATMINLKI